MKDLVTVRIESPAFDADAVRILELTGTETISRLFELTLRLVALDPAALDEEKLLTSEVELVFERTNELTHVVTEERRIGGMFSTLRDRFLTETEHREVIATFVPRAWQTTLTKTTDIFMDMSIPDIVKKKLETGAGLKGPDVEMRLKQTYPAREFVVQYKESDHDFICRLTEDLGIHFFFERKGEKDVMVFADENAAFKPSLPESAAFAKRGQAIGIFELEATRSVVPKLFKARDYNYRNPSMDLMGEVDAPTVGAAGVVDEFGPHAKTADEVKFYASVRAQEANTRHLVFEGHSDLPGLRAGSVIAIEGHPRGELKLVVVEVRHQGRQAVYGAAEGDAPYRNVFKAIPEKITFRPARLTPKPVVHGVVTGIVQSESATNFGAVDAEGRYRVSFMYDTVSDRGEGKASRPLRMAQPSSGAERGFHQPLKAGTEVIITCLNGDPDRPIISGAVPNPQTPSPVTSANAEKSMWKTNVNQIAIDDDKPRMKMTVSGSDHMFQIGEPNGHEYGFIAGTIGNWSTTAAGIATQAAATATTLNELKVAIAGKNIIAVAGVPNLWKLWEGVDQAVAQVVGWAKTAASVPTAIHKTSMDSSAEAKKQAEKEAKDAKKRIAGEQGLDTTKKPKANPDGTTRTETEEEAIDRALKERIDQDAAARKELEASKKQVDSAGSAEDKAKAEEADLALKEKKAKELGLDATPDPGLDAPGMPGLSRPPETKAQALDRVLTEKLKAAESLRAEMEGFASAVEEATNDQKADAEAWEESGWNPETGKIGQTIKAAEAVASVSSSVRKLVSAIGDLKAKVTDSTIYAAVAGAQRASKVPSFASGERRRSKAGIFAPMVNVQYSAMSTGTFALLNTFVGAGRTLDLAAPATRVIGASELHLKSKSLVEVSADEVVASAKKLVDVHSRKDLKLVAHTGAKAIAMPGGASMFFHAKDSLVAESTDKDVSLKAKKNVAFEAETENLTAKAKKGVMIVATDENIALHTSAKDIGAVSKANIFLTAQDKNVEVSAGKEVKITAKEAMTLDCASAVWKAKGEVQIEADKIVLQGSGPVRVRSSNGKISLG